MSRMSHDRVKFRLSQCPGHEAEEAFEMAMGVRFREVVHDAYTDCDGYSHFICRPSQFARFMIYRNDCGGKNGFKELKPELFTPSRQKKQPVDVSTNPHREF